MKRLFIFLSLAACTYPDLPRSTYWLNSADLATGAEVIEAYGNAPERCESSLRSVRVAVANEDEFASLCVYCGPGQCPGYRPSDGCPWGCASECYLSDLQTGWGGQSNDVIVVHQKSLEDEGVGGPLWTAHLRHGLAHWVSDCAIGDSDPQHTGDIWRAIGFN